MYKVTGGGRDTRVCYKNTEDERDTNRYPTARKQLLKRAISQLPPVKMEQHTHANPKDLGVQ
jgi:hypothetical protein